MTVDPPISGGLAGVPAEALLVPDAIPDRGTPIDEHPERREILSTITLWVLAPRSERLDYPISALWADLQAEFPDLTWGANPVANLQRYIERHVAPQVAITGDFVRRGLLNGETDLNLIRSQWALYEDARKLAQEAMARARIAQENAEALEADTNEGRKAKASALGVAAKLATQAVALAKASSEIGEKIPDLAERYGLMPGKVTKEQRLSVNLNLDSEALLAGRERERRRAANAQRRVAPVEVVQVAESSPPDNL